jgi:hypothetical protein
MKWVIIIELWYKVGRLKALCLAKEAFDKASLEAAGSGKVPANTEQP